MQRQVDGYSRAAPVRQNEKRSLFLKRSVLTHASRLLSRRKDLMGRVFRIPKEMRSIKMLPDVFSGAKNKCLSYIYIINVFDLCSF